MASNVQIVNSALTELGHDRISDLNQNTEAARVAKEVFDSERDSLLQEHPWTFAVKRVALALRSTTPDFGYSYEHDLPPNFLHLLETYPETPHEIEGSSLLCDLDTMYIKYIRRVTDPNEMKPLFRECLAARLAAKIATKMVTYIDKKDRMETLYRERLELARTRDSQGAGQPTPERPGVFRRARG